MRRPTVPTCRGRVFILAPAMSTHVPADLAESHPGAPAIAAPEGHWHGITGVGLPSGSEVAGRNREDAAELVISRPGQEGRRRLRVRRFGVKQLVVLLLLASMRPWKPNIHRLKQVLLLLTRRLATGAAKLALLGSAAAVFLYKAGSPFRREQRRRPKRVAVVGSGIAGSGAAWTLAKSGIDVVVYEKKPKLGGNAKSMAWDVDGKKVETGLAVLAWPEKLFHNYNALIDELKLPWEEHELRFFVSERGPQNDVKKVFAHGEANPEWVKEDLRKWDRMCAFVDRTNAFFSPSSVPSLYLMSWLNPLNLVSLRALSRFWGLSERFWNYVFVPIHTSTFLEVEMDTVPANMAGVLNQVVPFSSTPRMRTWKTTANEPILKMLGGIPSPDVRTSCGVEVVEFIPTGASSGTFDVRVTDENGQVEIYDAVVFACSAPAMNRILHGSSQGLLPGQQGVPNGRNGLNNGSFLSRGLDWLESKLLSMTLYTTDRDKTFERGIVHTKSRAVVPEAIHERVMASYCNYIEVDSQNPRELENSFIISSWAPTAQVPGIKGKLPMLVSYNAEAKLEGVDSEWVSTSREAHPCLTTWQLISSVVFWPLLQGSRNNQCYFCGSGVLPGNGHDLSFLSGIVAACQLGAEYPFRADEKAFGDYKRLCKIILGPWAS